MLLMLFDAIYLHLKNAKLVMQNKSEVAGGWVEKKNETIKG